MMRRHHIWCPPPEPRVSSSMFAALQQPAAYLPLACAAAKPVRQGAPSTTAATRRRLLLGLPLAGLAVLYSERVLAYGGSGNIRSTDSGSGNPRYEDLLADIQNRGGAKLSITTERPESTAPPLKGKCLTGREKACK